MTKISLSIIQLSKKLSAIWSTWCTCYPKRPTRWHVNSYLFITQLSCSTVMDCKDVLLQLECCGFDLWLLIHDTTAACSHTHALCQPMLRQDWAKVQQGVCVTYFLYNEWICTREPYKQCSLSHTMVPDIECHCFHLIILIIASPVNRVTDNKNGFQPGQNNASGLFHCFFTSLAVIG